MACFIVPATEAVITTIATKVIKSREEETEKIISDESNNGMTKIKFSHKLGWLNKLLWGGSALLAFEHLWHGEIVPFFPFLTAVKNGQTANMLSEMSSNGVMMTMLVTTVWIGMVAVSSVMEKKVLQDTQPKQERI